LSDHLSPSHVLAVLLRVTGGVHWGTVIRWNVQIVRRCPYLTDPALSPVGVAAGPEGCCTAFDEFVVGVVVAGDKVAMAVVTTVPVHMMHWRGRAERMSQHLLNDRTMFILVARSTTLRMS